MVTSTVASRCPTSGPRHHGPLGPLACTGHGLGSIVEAAVERLLAAAAFAVAAFAAALAAAALAAATSPLLCLLV